MSQCDYDMGNKHRKQAKIRLSPLILLDALHNGDKICCNNATCMSFGGLGGRKEVESLNSIRFAVQGVTTTQVIC